MPEYTQRLGLPKPLGNETHNRAAHNALVEAIDQNAASRSEAQAAQQTADAAQAAAVAAQAAADAAGQTAAAAQAAAANAQSTANSAQNSANQALSAAQDAQTAATTAQSTAAAANTLAGAAADASLVIEAALPVEGAEPEQVATPRGPAVQFADGSTQSVTFCRRWPFSGSALHMELVLAASAAHSGAFRIRVAYQVNGGSAVNVDKSVSPGSHTNLYTADLGQIIPAASLPAGALVTITLSRLGADAADTHTGAMLVYHCRLTRG
ncbi:hypothetical protein [Symbiobacterium terraclitae]|uniref:hypothetical protein n=1 Tax=Symbiobacterium terraclitae TaxID=557451 RepID=UPI0035B55AF6